MSGGNENEDTGRSAPKRLLDKAAWGGICLIMLTAIAAGPVGKKVLGLLDALDKRRHERGVHPGEPPFGASDFGSMDDPGGGR
jgi:hypothetical protein